MDISSCNKQVPILLWYLCWVFNLFPLCWGLNADISCWLLRLSSINKIFLHRKLTPKYIFFIKFFPYIKTSHKYVTWCLKRAEPAVCLSLLFHKPPAASYLVPDPCLFVEEPNLPRRLGWHDFRALPYGHLMFFKSNLIEPLETHQTNKCLFVKLYKMLVRQVAAQDREPFMTPYLLCHFLLTEEMKGT